MAAGRFAVYLIGLLLVLAAVWLLLAQTGIASIIPMSLIAIALLLILGVALMRGARTVGPTYEVVEPRTTIVERRAPDETVVEERPVDRRWWR